MIDLNKVNSKYVTIKVGTQMMKCKRASIELYQRMINMQELSDGIEMMDEIYTILTEIFNLNIEGEIYKKADIQGVISIDMAMDIVMKYVQDCNVEMGK